jgi:hypothetical protein
MEMTEYVLVLLANERVAHAREVAARRALAASLVPRERLRDRLGTALVALGHRLLGGPAAPAPRPAASAPQRLTS